MTDGVIGRFTRYIPHTPHPRQHAFLILDDIPEILFGGAAGGGKSDALLMGALQYVDVPGYAAIVFRKTYKDLSLPGALMSRAHEWLGPTDAHWNATEKTWTFPSGATLTFGSMEHEKDKFDYQGAHFQYVGFDELTQFTETQYRYLFSRLRRLEGSNIPIRMRAASNPGGIGHEWVRGRFIEEVSDNRLFLPSKLRDNPSLDAEAYIAALGELDEHTRQQLLDGNWDARVDGDLYKRIWFQNRVDECDAWPVFRVRAWDLAALERRGDHTVGTRVALTRSQSHVDVEDVVRGQWGPAVRDDMMQKIARADARVPGCQTLILVEQQPGAAGIVEMTHIAALLSGFPVEFIKPTGPKTARWQPYRSGLANGRVRLRKGPWNYQFVEEHVGAQLELVDRQPNDQIDSASLAYARIYPAGWKAMPARLRSERTWTSQLTFSRLGNITRR